MVGKEVCVGGGGGSLPYLSSPRYLKDAMNSSARPHLFFVFFLHNHEINRPHAALHPSLDRWKVHVYSDVVQKPSEPRDARERIRQWK